MKKIIFTIVLLLCISSANALTIDGSNVDNKSNNGNGGITVKGNALVTDDIKADGKKIVIENNDCDTHPEKCNINTDGNSNENLPVEGLNSGADENNNQLGNSNENKIQPKKINTLPKTGPELYLLLFLSLLFGFFLLKKQSKA